MKRLMLAAVAVLSIPVFAQPPPPAPRPAPAGAPPPPAAAPAPAPAPAAAPPPAAAAPPPAAPAPAPAAAGAAVDWSRVGPAARRPTNEAATRKDVDAFIKQQDALVARRDFNALASRVDFPLHLVTDSTSGAVQSSVLTREQFLTEMRPVWESTPADAKVAHRLTITVLSDSLVNVVDDYTMTMGKQSVKGRNASLLVRVNGGWRYKALMEGGWGGAAAPAPAPVPAAAAAPAPAPAPAAAPPPAAAPAPAPAPRPAPPPPGR